MSNFEIALKAEMKRVTRCFHHYTSEQRANHAASFRLSQRKRQSLGEFFYIHPNLPNKAFPRRSDAARAALAAA